ncbi:L-aspartate oxidase [Propionicimonas sp.]|uniref:L-aspartate oxidase n=1 Tax=Propionicimonas sp. TaxID=1955623 RepID=UPI00183E2E6F|nr:L-aspartate oxidase [Propionicimonas sp.]MBU3975998.1 L-aspartate oxidase [Actinomycetota bacterium]MBA3020812.1 L-aspartate oxidase [Propionicimonas sp.]MBU3985188.1 L-aspartate oxidase [Actinomycetota bacterium]MBU4008178.1 L-aspartate oxidase [Actinomycetota bacterium]MBU4064608.1 L-aspartate oxidase [Actinomycetota bacterium]
MTPRAASGTPRRVIQAGGPVIIGAGLAGLSAAVELAPLPCVVLSAGQISTGTSTGWAQGGVSAAVGPDDNAGLHTADTIAAGAGLCDADVVAAITSAAPQAIEWLTAQGAQFDRTADGSLKLGLEGAHSRRRIVHAMGDSTGAELLRTMVVAARRTPSISLWEYSLATEILTTKAGVSGVLVRTAGGEIELRTDTVLLATGGIGGLFSHTTNPLTSRGQGLALAHRAGATLRDIEMVQFHPTALDVGIDPMPLVSEAVRGEGAILVDELGERVIDNPLSARDVVARAEWAALQAGHQVFLDAREHPGVRFDELFASIAATAREAGFDPVTQPLPVRPAAHYHMGGVQVDLAGRTDVPGLYAAGEVASTGLHGANRLASNSLLEAVVCGRWTAQHWHQLGLDQGSAAAAPSGLRPVTPGAPDAAVAKVRGIVSEAAGVLRDRNGLVAALAELKPLRSHDAGLVGYLLVEAALRRTESRGGHTRTDFPKLADPARHLLIPGAGRPRAATEAIGAVA